MHRSADQYHGGDTLGLKSRHVQQEVAAHADADSSAALNAEMVEEGEGIVGALTVGDFFGGIR
jgi:hypothetical protein